MSAPRFLQIHTLHSYTAALLNRDDSGLAKRLRYGDTMRIRISSQALKRHWRDAEQDPHALQKLAGFVDSARSREIVTKRVTGALEKEYPADVLKALDAEFQKQIYGKNADKGIRSRQTLLLGMPEIDWLKTEAEKLAKKAEGDPKAAAKLAEEWSKAFKDNIKQFRETTALPGGIAAALFGRMVTSDPLANIDAPVHVAHAFTVHAAEADNDYFTAVDDLREDFEEAGADTIQETELTSGLFYGYVVIDLPGLITNLGGNRELAAQIVHNLIYLIAEVSPGAKLGSTAPYGRAEFLLVEAGDRQPRSLAAAWRKPSPHDRERALHQLRDHLADLDAAYATGEERHVLSLSETVPAGLARESLADIAGWAGRQAEAAPDA